MHTAEPLVPESSVFESEMVMEKNGKAINHQLFVKLQQNRFKQELGQGVIFARTDCCFDDTCISGVRVSIC